MSKNEKIPKQVKGLSGIYSVTLNYYNHYVPPFFIVKFIDLKSQISSTQLQMVRQAHHPESGRRVNPKIQDPNYKNIHHSWIVFQSNPKSVGNDAVVPNFRRSFVWPATNSPRRARGLSLSNGSRVAF